MPPAPYPSDDRDMSPERHAHRSRRSYESSRRRTRTRTREESHYDDSFADEPDMEMGRAASGPIDMDDVEAAIEVDDVGTVDVDELAIDEADNCGVGWVAFDVDEENGVPVARPSFTQPGTGTPSSSSKKERSALSPLSSRKFSSRKERRSRSGGERRRSGEGKRRRKMKRERSVRPRPKNYNFDLPDAKRDEDDGRCWSRLWYGFSVFSTFLIPSCLIPRDGDAAKLAWREKLAFFNIFMVFNIIFLIAFGVIPLYFCREETPLDGYEWYDGALGPTCYGLNIAMYAILFLVAGLLVLQCLCSLALGFRSFIYRCRNVKNFEHDDLDEAVMVMVPCYNEGFSELRKTIDSILHTKYPDDNKIMVVVADGIIHGKGEELNTPKTLATILGFKLRKRDKGYAYKSIGSSDDNRASVYHGTYESEGRSLKYIVIVKRGTPAEKESAKPGNRGKRDSQLIALGLFNRVHHDRRLCELDEAVCDAMNDLELPVTELRYLLAIDADTRISSGSISHMTYFMEKNKKCLACCGETKVDNKITSWVTAIQVFEYFASHQLKKAFEGAFGCVTCLPGCFTMYRIFCDSGFHPLISDDKVYQAYRRNDIESLHEKNLYHLGEDRMLTTLLLKHFPDMRLSFVPWAKCWTIVPDKFWVLLSQRRRWINSTFHNMLELLKVRTMCGCCCLSMKLIVILDMVSTLILPASVVYALSFIYVVFWEKEPFSLVTLILYGIIFGVQFLVFVVRGRLDYVFWFLVYFILGIPVFYFILPLYSFWRMDDLSWGQTRQVAAEPQSAKK